MAVSARMSTNWALRMGLVLAAFGAFAVWCLVDARIGYPGFNRRAAEYNRLLAAGQADQWPGVAAGQGWSATFSEADHLPNGAISVKTPWDIGTQYVMMGACLVMVVGVAYRLLRARRRTLTADDDGFVTVEGVRVPYADITDIDLRRWQSKSIARISYRQANRQRTTDVDDWIYQGGEAVLAELQRHTGLGVPATPGTADAAPALVPQPGPPAPAGEQGKPNGRDPAC